MTTPVPVTDGRSARSQRTRQAVVDALLALLREGNPRPTAREIADRAQVSLRSVYVHFDDLEDLFVAASQRQGELVRDLVYEVPAEGPLRERAAAVVRQRGRMYDEVGHVMRAASIQEPFSPTLSRLNKQGRRVARDDIARLFAEELDRLDPPLREERLALIDALTSRGVWETMRESHELDHDTAVAALSHAVVKLLEEPRP